MSNQMNRWALAGAMVLTLAAAACSLPCGAQQVALDLRPIARAPEPPGKLHPKLQWAAREKVRGIWIGNDLYEKFENGDKTMGEVLKDAGFNLACVSMNPNTDGKASGFVDITRPYDLKYDRSRSGDIEDRLAPNVKEARRLGLKIMVVWKYGTHHLEPYRKYRNPSGVLAKLTCCPMDYAYVTGQHVGKWAVKIAQGGADGMVLDMEMYQSDTAWPEGACTCDDCFATYLRRYAKDWKTINKEVTPENRGKWLVEQKAMEHYTDFLCKRMEAMYDFMRARCQRINPAFVFGVAGQMYHMPGLYHMGAPVERGFGTASVPCMVFSEHEYPIGPYRGSYVSMKRIEEGVPAMFLVGAYVAMQSPQLMADNAVMSSLYCDGWWAWYGTALLTNTKADQNPGIPYGRVQGTTAQDYLEKTTAANKRIDNLLALPKSQWPERKDMMPDFKLATIAEAEAKLAQTGTEEAKKELEDAKASYESYMELVKQGGY